MKVANPAWPGGVECRTLSDMAMGKRPAARQAAPMWVDTSDPPTGDGHPYFERLNRVLADSGFDAYVEELCAAFYADRLTQVLSTDLPATTHAGTRQIEAGAGGRRCSGTAAQRPGAVRLDLPTAASRLTTDFKARRQRCSRAVSSPLLQRNSLSGRAQEPPPDLRHERPNTVLSWCQI